jgi:hypothetical protein
MKIEWANENRVESSAALSTGAVAKIVGCSCRRLTCKDTQLSRLGLRDWRLPKLNWVAWDLVERFTKV